MRKMTPIQEYSQMLAGNHDKLQRIRQLRNSLIGLSPETSEAFRNFIDRAYMDTRAIKDQKDLYKKEASEGRSQVRVYNNKVRKEDTRRREEVIFGSIRASCTRCYGTGKGVPIGSTPIFCSCKMGVEAYCEYQNSTVLAKHPNWKSGVDQENNEIWMCCNCDHAWTAKRLHDCLNGTQ